MRVGVCYSKMYEAFTCCFQFIVLLKDESMGYGVNCERILEHPFPRWRLTRSCPTYSLSIKPYKIALNSIVDSTIEVSKHEFETERKTQWKRKINVQTSDS